MKFRLQNLDSIRSIAFLTVFLGHPFVSDQSAVANSYTNKVITFFADFFSFGVPLFFVLSGFLITYLMLKEQEVGFSIKNFYIRRVLRIFPVYFLVLLFGFFIYPLVREWLLHLPYQENASLLKYILFQSNFDQLQKEVLPTGIGLSPTWSVSVEEQFYLLWPMLLLLFPQKKLVIPIVVLMLLSISLVPAYHLPSKHTITCFIYLTSGALFAYLSYYHFDVIKKITQLNGWLFIAFTLLVLTIIYYQEFGGFSAFKKLFIALSMGYIIVYQCFSGKMSLNKVPLLERLGKYTYGLYLYHIICNFFIHALVFHLLHINDSVFITLLLKPFLSMVLSITVSYVSFHYYERFFLNLKNKYATIDTRFYPYSS